MVSSVDFDKFLCVLSMVEDGCIILSWIINNWKQLGKKRVLVFVSVCMCVDVCVWFGWVTSPSGVTIIGFILLWLALKPVYIVAKPLL